MKVMQMTIRRAPRPDGVHYVESDDGVHNDPRLSWSARGLGQYLLSKPYGWTDTFKSLECAAAAFRGKPNDDKALRALFHELMVAGYVRREELHSSDAATANVEYHISDQPHEVDAAQIEEAVSKMLNAGRQKERPTEILRRVA